MKSRSSDTAFRTLLKWSLPVMLLGIGAAIVVGRVGKATHQDLDAARRAVIAVTQIHPEGSAYLVELDGVCDRTRDTISVPALNAPSGLKTATVATPPGARALGIKHVSGRVWRVRWPAFTSSLIHAPVSDVHWTALAGAPSQDQLGPEADGMWHAPMRAIDAITISTDFQAEAGREKQKPLMRLKPGLLYIDPNRSLHPRELANAKDVESALVEVLDRFGGIVFYTECHDNTGGLYDLNYYPPDQS